ncbi:MAG: homocysteine methyltransferase [Pirellulales bacterium]|nr:homocysteine methyltransferase [Pirellulales bacterium]
MPEPTVVLDLMEAFRRSKVMFAAVKLGVFDALQSGAKSSAALAAELNLNVDAIQRLLGACVSLNLLSQHGERFENTTTAATYLTRSSPRRLTGYINFSNEFAWKMWGNLEDAIREGTNRWQQTFGWEGGIFSHLFCNENAKREFLMGMHGFGMINSPLVVGAFDLSRFQTFCDLGGATGHMAIAACERYPNLQAIVFDLPEALPLANEIVGASSVADRIRLMGGDFFTDALPACDLIGLGRILHDWPEEKINRLLHSVHDRLPSGGGLLVAEKLLREDKSGPRWAQMQNLNMLACAEGKERTLGEYEKLLCHAGFSDVIGCRLPVPGDVILAIKP